MPIVWAASCTPFCEMYGLVSESTNKTVSCTGVQEGPAAECFGDGQYLPHHSPSHARPQMSEPNPSEWQMWRFALKLIITIGLGFCFWFCFPNERIKVVLPDQSPWKQSRGIQLQVRSFKGHGSFYLPPPLGREK